MNKQTFFGLVDKTWHQLFGRPIEFAEPQHFVNQYLLECFVEIPIKGEHTFFLVLALPNNLSYLLASILFEIDQSAIKQDDAEDALKEIGNIIAGGIQRLISEETTLDLPIQLTKETALNLMKDIEPDWEIYLKDENACVYAGVFVGSNI